MKPISKIAILTVTVRYLTGSWMHLCIEFNLKVFICEAA